MEIPKRYVWNTVSTRLIISAMYIKLIYEHNDPNKEHFFSEQEYHQIPGKSCYIDQIIETEPECKAAIGSLGLSFVRSIRSNTKPSGCFYEVGYYNGNGGRGYFNQYTDPSSTNPDNLGLGICKGKGITHSLLNRSIFRYTCIHLYTIV